MTVNNKVSIQPSRLIFLIVIIALLTTTLIFVNTANNEELSSKADTLARNTLTEISSLISEDFTSIIDRYESELISVSNALNYISDHSTRITYLKQMSMRNNNTYFVFSNSQGIINQSYGMDLFSIAATDFFKNAINGRSVNSVFHHRTSKGIDDYLVFARPVCSALTDTPIGVVCEFVRPDTIINSLSIDIYNTQVLLCDSTNNSIAYSSTNLIDEDKMTSLERIICASDFLSKYDESEYTENILHYSKGSSSQYIKATPINDHSYTIYTSICDDMLSINTASYTRRTVITVIIYLALLITVLFVYISPIVVEYSRKRAYETQSLMFANVSHELRTPLNTIIGVSEILSRSELSDGQLRQLAYISDSGKSLLAIINDLLDFSKLSSNKFGLLKEPYSLEDIIYDTTTVATTRLNNRPIKFIVNVSSYVPKNLIGDGLRVRQLITNVISNAVKYTEKGHIIFTVDCEYISTDSLRLILKVEDTGIGIRKENLNAIFDNYTRFDSGRNKHIEGTGLGMPIAKQFAKLMGGDITVESTYRQGSTFTINIIQNIGSKETLLPEFDNSKTPKKLLILEKSELLSDYYTSCLEEALVDFEITDDNYEFSSRLSDGNYDFILADPDTIAMLREEFPVPEGCTLVSLVHTNAYIENDGPVIYVPLFSIQIYSYLTGRNLSSSHKALGSDLKITLMPEKRILVVDDNVMNLQVATGIMEPYHMTIDTASSGNQALELIKTSHYDLIFMDHMMPGMDGEETLHKIKELGDDKYTSIPVIACTANASAGARTMFSNMGFDDFISKPLDIYSLHELLYKWLTPAKDAEVVDYKHGNAEEEAALDDNESKYVDYKEGLQRIGSMPIYLKTLRNFCDSIPKKKDIISFSFPNDLKTFVIEVHGLKGVAAIVSANELAKQSLALEMLGKSEDVASIEPLLDDYYKYMMEVKEDVEHFLQDHT